MSCVTCTHCSHCATYHVSWYIQGRLFLFLINSRSFSIIHMGSLIHSLSSPSPPPSFLPLLPPPPPSPSPITFHAVSSTRHLGMHLLFPTTIPVDLENSFLFSSEKMEHTISKCVCVCMCVHVRVCVRMCACACACVCVM